MTYELEMAVCVQLVFQAAVSKSELPYYGTAWFMATEQCCPSDRIDFDMTFHLLLQPLLSLILNRNTELWGKNPV